MKALSTDEKRARILIALTLCVILIGFGLFFFQFPSDYDAEFVFSIESDGFATVKGYEGNPKTLKIPATTPEGVAVKYIGESAFGGHASNLEKVVIPEGVEAIGDYAFANAPNLSRVVLPSTLKSIGRGAFSNCTYLESITLPEGLLTLDAEVFDSCARLSRLKIPRSVESIGVDCFLSCESLRLDVSENSIAAEIAENYRIETGLVSVFSIYFVLAIVLSVLSVAAVFYGGHYIKKKISNKKTVE